MTERPNIRRLQVADKSERERMPFDPERDLSAEDWQGMEADAKKSAIFSNLFKVASKLKILRPQTEMPLNVGWTIDELHRRVRNKDWDSVVDVSAAIKIIDPTFRPPLSPEQKSELRQVTKWITNPRVLAELTLIDPEWKISDDVFQDIVKKWEKDRGQSIYYEALANLRIASGGKKILLEEFDWRHMRQLLEMFRLAAIDDKYDDFAGFAATMKILAAEEVRVTERGLEIRMRKERSDGSEPRQPETLAL